MNAIPGTAVRRVAVPSGLFVVAVLLPLVLPKYWVGTLLTEAMIFGIVAAGLVFLSTYGGMVSLAQVALFGIAGFAIGNLARGTSHGLNVGWPLWGAVAMAILFTAVLALVFGTLAARSTGIYFLMLTLTLAVITSLFFGQATSLSGFGGVSGIPSPGFLGSSDTQPNRWYYFAFAMSLLVYAALKYLARTPFGLALQGVRDDPVRMASLGYNVSLHRTVAFTAAGVVAAVGGVMYAWWNGHLDPASIGLGPTIDVLIIAVIGGLRRLSGAWIGAVFFYVVNELVRHVGAFGARFHTVIGAVFLVVILVSPDGLTGAWDRAVDLVRARLAPAPGTADSGRSAMPAGQPPLAEPASVGEPTT